MAYETILAERRGQQDGVLWITLNRPDRLNALVPQLYAELNQELVAARDDRSVRCIVITGAGRGFCAGADHKVASGRESGDGALDLEAGRMGLIKNAQAFVNLRKVDVPVIASVNGVCVGGGFDLVCLCDMVVGSTAARYQVAYAKRGLYPDMGGFWSIPRAIGWNKAIEMMTTGRFMSAEEAHAAGLSNYLVEPEQLEAQTMELAQMVEAAPPIGVKLSKHLAGRTQYMDYETAMDWSAGTVAVVGTSQDRVEGVKSFVEKREPRFEGR
ncbi:MAG TPA: enoyl-CoA hydratase/isomerase family protein [Dehalococcoidia bacterium]|nr:enoyl-CoA hydratase/isomerase family protein [Dehalococcoidia bacterium]